MKQDPVTNKWEYDFETFESLITERTKAMFLINPHNPTGKMLTMSEIERLTEILDKYPDIIVFSDDVYFHLPLSKDQGLDYNIFAAYKNNWQRTLTFYSVGKLFSCTGWKVGWVFGPDDLIEHIA
jgi:aspartate/methionine/tyrosine aminotransferase